MKVITKVTIDMGTNTVIECESYDYDGPVAECKGGGSSTTTATTTGEIDYEYNDRMATIAEAQQEIADEYALFWRDEYKPLESAQIQANKELIPFITDAEKARLEAETLLTGDRTGLEQTKIQQEQLGLPIAGALQREQMESERRLTPQREELESTRLGVAQTEAEGAAPVISEFYKQALRGVDVEGAVGEARADVASAFKGAESAERRALGRIGVVGQDRTQEEIRKRFTEQAKATAFAGTGAKKAAEEQSFQRLGAATQSFRGGIGGGG